MNNQLIDNTQALRMFFEEDVYILKNKNAHHTKPQPVDTIATKVDNPKNIEEKIIPPTPTTKPTFEFKGQNQRKILILTHDKQYDESDETGTELLRKLLIAIKIGGKDFALLNYARYEKTDYKTLIDFFESKIILAFGVSASMLQISEKPLNTIIIENDTKIIFTSNLRDLAHNNAEKAALWKSLQQLEL